ncbi:MAG: hypothetical protein CSA54_02145 [Gammaproteobacteria bacterium]|nr:MAG: hypothetical protein CSA54_02145 [Gammaproteobacteria bacterium]
MLTTLKRSRTARLLSWLVATVLFVVQMFFIVPLSWSGYSNEVAELVATERARIDLALRYSDPGDLEVDQAILNDAVVGLMLKTPNGELLFRQGEVPLVASDLSNARQDAGAIGRVAVHRGLKASSWTQQTLGDEISVEVWIDPTTVGSKARFTFMLLLFFALIASVVGAVAALLGTCRYYIRPVDELIRALRAGRENGGGRPPKLISDPPNNELRPLADEFNSLIEEQKKAARQVKVKQQYLEFAAHHDPLTQLPNRALYEQEMKKTAEAALKSGARFAVFLVDLDNFKFFNDQHGHLVGDKMLAEVGNRLRTMMRDIDLVARLDGDEFVVIQRNVPDRDVAEEVANRVMKVATAPYEYRGLTLKPAVSIGISCYPADSQSKEDEGQLGEEMLNNASVALQDAKSGGKNCYRLFNEEMRSRATARIRIEQDLKLAMQHGQFELYYQPKINIATRAIIGAEALIRWRHPVNGFMSPDAFVPIAEEAGLIVELGEWILETACEQTLALRNEGFDGINIAVNISAVQFTDRLVPSVNAILDKTGFPVDSLELEITESAVMDDPEMVINTLNELSQCGLRLAIDDFGTGYSSLAYLKRFPVDTLKIDRAFITDVSTDRDDEAIVQAVLGLARHFGMKVVAEGVEAEDQLNYLKQEQCDIAQGYFISKPLSFNEYRQWLKRWPYGVEVASEVARQTFLPAPRTGTDN